MLKGYAWKHYNFLLLYVTLAGRNILIGDHGKRILRRYRRQT
jgi:hypothetical protein